MAIEIWLDFPSALSANRSRRGTMASRTGHEKDDRERAGKQVRALMALGRTAIEVGDGDIPCEITVCAPDLRRRDMWNVPFALKASMDGICDALGIDDVRLAPITIVRGESGVRGPSKLPGAVKVRLG